MPPGAHVCVFPGPRKPGRFGYCLFAFEQFGNHSLLMNPSRIYIIAGESSGDAHGAVLMRELAELLPGVQFFGAGGPQMQKMASNPFLNWTPEAVVGLWDVLVKYPYFRRRFYEMYEQIRQIEPAAVIFVDYPGFNLRLAAYLRRKGFKGKLIDYISPQVWAWNRGRIPRMAKFLDLMMCIFPFEKPLYEASGLRTEFVGHPMMQELERHRTAGARDPELVALLPGSRGREVKRIFPVMLRAAQLLRARDGNIRFEASAASEATREMMQEILDKTKLNNVLIGLRNSYDLMQRAHVGMVASGTATLESTFYRMPFVLIYKVSWLTYIPGRMLVRVDHLGMANILAGREIIPEFIQHEAKAERIADAVWNLYSNPWARTAMLGDMVRVTESLGKTGTGRRAAEAVVCELQGPLMNENQSKARLNE
jgi:lipid-A-disaccharide synthase